MSFAHWTQGLSRARRQAVLYSSVRSYSRRRPRCSFESMLRLPVPPEIHLPLEALPTQVAAEGLETRVLSAVGNEVGALTERFAAHLAFVGLLTCKDGRPRAGSMSL